jgi:NADP-dependent 3-hydroxy acid dehydrogenase YdfG
MLYECKTKKSKVSMDTSPVIIITGASSGIGAAVARLFSQEGYRVVLAARRINRLEILADEIRDAGGTALAVKTDVTQLEHISNMIEISLEKFNQIDILFNNAGVPSLDWLEKLDTSEGIDTPLFVNLWSVIHTARVVLPHMIERRKGHIINMASMAGLVAPPTYSVYAASKFGVRGFTEALRREVGLFGIDVSAIYPGGVKTDFIPDPAAMRKTGLTTPRIFTLKVDDVARTVLRIASNPRKMVIIPWPMRLVYWLNLMFPSVVDWGIERGFTRIEREIDIDG